MDGVCFQSQTTGKKRVPYRIKYKEKLSKRGGDKDEMDRSESTKAIRFIRPSFQAELARAGASKSARREGAL